MAFVTDSTNAGIFSTTGTNHVVLAITSVIVSNVTPGIGDILEFDVALNATTRSGTPVWSWVAENDDGTLFASRQPTINVPFDGYADIQGVLTHEFGHAAGLGHSVIDSESSGISSLTPTMFPFAQPEVFNETINIQSGCGSSGQYSSNPDATVFGGILGRSARTIEADDIAAISRGYPGDFFFQDTGTITGNTNGIAGASIVAISTTSPETVRIGTLSYFAFPPGAPTGNYTLSGLPPDTYYVYAEPIDRTYFPGFFDVPNYVLAGSASPPGCKPGCSPGPTFPCPGCGGPCTPPCTPCLNPNLGGLPTQPVVFPREWFNSSDVSIEPRQKITEITVEAGQLVTGINFNFDSATNPQLRLEVAVGSPASGPFTSRGVVVPAWSNDLRTVPSVVTFRVTGQPFDAGRSVHLKIRYDLVNSVSQGELREVPSSGPPKNFLGVLNGNGVFTATYTLSPSTQMFRNMFAQASLGSPPIGEPGSPPPPPDPADQTNTVNVWIGLAEPLPNLP